MKGYFHLRADPYTDELHFGNLNDDMSSLGCMSDALRCGSSIGRLVAHDVIEHSSAHRTNKYVSWEDEIRAFGAASFVREGEIGDSHKDTMYMCDYLNRDIKPVPYIIGKFLLDGYRVEVEFMREMVKFGISPKNARNIAYQYAWGRYQKENQFPDQYTARNAFNFIENNIIDVIKSISYKESWGASIFFDTVKHIFRYRMKGDRK